jgi:hypothetical protein
MSRCAYCSAASTEALRGFGADLQLVGIGSALDLAEGGQAIKDEEPAGGAAERRRRAPRIELNFASPSPCRHKRRR